MIPESPLRVDVPSGRHAPDREVVYLVQLDPDCDPRRLKVGYTRRLDRRVRSFQMICPAARAITSADGDRSLEALMIVSFDQSFRRIGRELFEADLDEAKKRFEEVVWRVSH